MGGQTVLGSGHGSGDRGFLVTVGYALTERSASSLMGMRRFAHFSSEITKIHKLALDFPMICSKRTRIRLGSFVRSRTAQHAIPREQVLAHKWRFLIPSSLKRCHNGARRGDVDPVFV